MNQLVFDGRALIGIVSSVIRQEDPKVAFSRLDWERMYRIADYHKVANIVYLRMLGHRENIPEKWKERFFARYQQSLLFGEHYAESVKETLMWLDARKISCTVMHSETIRDLYQIPEAADMAPLFIYLDEKSYSLARGYLIDLGYETDQEYKDFGERLKRTSGVSVVLCHKLPFCTAKYIRGMRKLLESACIRESCQYIRMLPPESELIYRMASAAYRYVTDELTVREVLDLQLCHRAWRDSVHMDVVEKSLSEYQVQEIAEKILRISYMWFGDKKDTYYEYLPEDMSAYDVLEERLLTRGMVKHETDVQALKLEKLIHKELEKEKREEKRARAKERRKEWWDGVKRKLRWIFPDRHYMASIYPVLEKVPVLLPFYWMTRGVRLLRRSLKK